MKTFRERWSGKGFTEAMNESEDGEDWDKAETEGTDIGTRMVREGDWAGPVVVFIVGWPSAADAVQGAVNAVVWSNNIKELNECKIFEDIFWGGGGLLCEAEKGDKI